MYSSWAGHHVYHKPGCFCIFVWDSFFVDYCSTMTLVPNPIFKWGTATFHPTGCIEPSEAAQLLSHSHDEWGLDCILDTPDDDINEVG